MNEQTVGSCSLCGGAVTLPLVWHCVVPPVATCSRCGAVEAAHGPVIPMQQPVRIPTPFNGPRVDTNATSWTLSEVPMRPLATSATSTITIQHATELEVPDPLEDLLRTLTPEEYDAAPVPSAKEIRAAIARGSEAMRQAAKAPRSSPRSTGQRYRGCRR